MYCTYAYWLWADYNQKLTWKAIVKSVRKTYPYFMQQQRKDWVQVELAMKEKLLDSTVFCKVTKPDGNVLWSLKSAKDTKAIKDEPMDSDDPLGDMNAVSEESKSRFN